MKPITRRQVLKYSLYGTAGTVLGSTLWVSGCARAAKTKRPNVILITLDTTRRDRLGCYGYSGRDVPISPSIDAIAADAMVYDTAYAPSNWTLPSHASLFTGKFTTSHGAQFDPQGPLSLVDQLEGQREFWSHFRARGLSPDEATMAMLLKQAGYVTGGVGAGPWLKRVFGLAKGFDFYDDANITTNNGRSAADVTDTATRWLGQVGHDEFFLFVNYFDPHFPYWPPDGAAYRFFDRRNEAELNEIRQAGGFHKTYENALYDAEILYMDTHVGRLVAWLKQNGLYDNTWIIVASDHGEMLGEHDLVGHGHRLYQQEIHIPLLMKHPHGEVSPSRTDTPIQLTDVLPMVLHRLGIAAPPGIQGGRPPAIGHPIVSEVYPLEFLSKDGDSQAIVQGPMKCLWNAKGNHALFDLAKDPGEEINLIQKTPDRATAMQNELRGYLASLPKPKAAAGPESIDEETQRALESLGYTSE